MSYKERTPINELLANPELYFYENSACGFYDWFCSSTSLESRARRMLPKLQLLVDEGLLNGDDHYVWFNNRCPMSGKLYDDMRFSRISDEEFLGGLCPSCGHDSTLKQASIWSIESDDVISKEYKSWRELRKALTKDEELRSIIRNALNPSPIEV